MSIGKGSVGFVVFQLPFAHIRMDLRFVIFSYRRIKGTHSPCSAYCLLQGYIFFLVLLNVYHLLLTLGALLWGQGKLSLFMALQSPLYHHGNCNVDALAGRNHCTAQRWILCAVSAIGTCAHPKPELVLSSHAGLNSFTGHFSG